MIMILGSEEADLFIPPDSEVQPRDPVTENMELLNARPVKAGPGQNHDAHIAVHMAAIQDPSMQAMLKDNPMAPQIMASAMAHVQEHLAFQYRQQLEQQLGVPLPPPGEPLPEDVEYELATLTSEAADKLLGLHTTEQAAKAAEAAANDPIVQNEQRALDIKEQANQIKAASIEANQKDKAEERRLKAMLTILKEMSETERSTLAVQIQGRQAADDNLLRRAELAADMRGTEMSQIVKLLGATTKARGKAE
jgi:hypothetical protein